MSDLIPTEVYDTYWRFAAERQAIYYKRLSDPFGPWTNDPILREYRFTNVFRAADRVSQYLLREVQYRADRSQEPPEVFFRTLLFKLFNRIETWEALEAHLGPVGWKTTSLSDVSSVLDQILQRGCRVYSAAYIMPSPAFGYPRKHANHLALLGQMMEDQLYNAVASVSDLRNAYELVRSYSGLGSFLAFQYTIDLNYSTLLNFDESDCVVAGPGALDGIAKCFSRTGAYTPEEIIHVMVDRQEVEFARLGLNFDGLFGRPLHPIDCQNLFCEISKYARVKYPTIVGTSGRTRIKQRFRPDDGMQFMPFFPPKWGICVSNHDAAALSRAMPAARQMSLL